MLSQFIKPTKFKTTFNDLIVSIATFDSQWYIGVFNPKTTKGYHIELQSDGSLFAILELLNDKRDGFYLDFYTNCRNISIYEKHEEIINLKFDNDFTPTAITFYEDNEEFLHLDFD